MRFLIFFMPFVAFCSSIFNPGINAKMHFMDETKNPYEQKVQLFGMAVEPCVKGDLFAGINYKTCVVANAPILNHPKNYTGDVFRLDFKDKPEAGAYLSVLSLNLDAHGILIRTYHHEINSPLLKTQKQDLLPTFVEGITAKFNSNKSELVLGGYSRIFGKGAKNPTKKGKFITITDSINQEKNTNDNYLVMVGYNFKDSQSKIGSSIYYYKILKHFIVTKDGIEKENSPIYIYADLNLGYKNTFPSKTMINGELITDNRHNLWVFSIQGLHLEDGLKNQMGIFGLRTIYKYSNFPMAYFISINTASQKNSGLKLPFETDPTYTATNDFYLSSLDEPNWALSLKNKLFLSKINLDFYFSHFRGKDRQKFSKATIYGAKLESKFSKHIWFEMFMQNQIFTNREKDTSSLKTQLNVSLSY